MLTFPFGDPSRTDKPRQNGRTILNDPGLPAGSFADIVQSYHPLIDAVEFGGGACMSLKAMTFKAALLAEQNIPYWFDGLILERASLERQFDNAAEWLGRMGVHYAVISNQAGTLSFAEKQALIGTLASELKIIAEIRPAECGDAAKWIEAIWRCLETGAFWVMLHLPISAQQNEPILDAILTSDLFLDDIVFAAANRRRQAGLINRLGCNVNLSHIAPQEIAALEALRRGLCRETFSKIPEQHHHKNTCRTNIPQSKHK